MTRTRVKHFFMRRGLGSSWISTTRHPPSRRSAWLTAARLAAALDLSPATTTTTLMGARSLAGGSSHLQGVTRDRQIINFLQKTCISTSMKVAMRGP
jgi:hypothetical protein